MSVNRLDQSASLPFQDLAGQTVAIDKRKTVKQDLSNSYQSTSPYQTSHLLDWPPSLSFFYPACDQCQLPQGGMSLQAHFSPQDYNPFCQFSKLKQWEKYLLIRPGVTDWETLRTLLTSLQQGEWRTSRFPTPSPLSTNKEVPRVFHVQGLPHQFNHSPLACSRYNGIFSRWWRRRSNYGITKYHNPPVRLVGQSQFPPSLSPA